MQSPERNFSWPLLSLCEYCAQARSQLLPRFSPALEVGFECRQAGAHESLSCSWRGAAVTVCARESDAPRYDELRRLATIT